MTYKYQSETVALYRKITSGTVAQKEMELGLHENEPLIIAMDSMLRYAKAYRKEYEGPVNDREVRNPVSSGNNESDFGDYRR